MYLFDKALISALIVVGGAGLVSACNKEQVNPKPEAQVQADLNASTEKNRHRRQRTLDEASIVCRDGTAYLMGDNYDTMRDSGPFAVPYYRNGEIVKCGASNFDNNPTAKKEM